MRYRGNMKLSKKKAVDLSIELWAWLAETGEEKQDWPGWASNGGPHSAAAENCFLCEYDDQHCRKDAPSCEKCPYFQAYEVCDDHETPYRGWIYSRNVKERKEHARQFLAQLTALREEK